MAKISDQDPDLVKVDTIFSAIGISTSIQERQIIKKVVEIIGTRAARLSAVGVAACVLRTTFTSKLVVAIDGSVFEHYPHFETRMKTALEEMLGPLAQDIILEQARDGSGQGAAIIAALA